MLPSRTLIQEVLRRMLVHEVWGWVMGRRPCGGRAGTLSARRLPGHMASGMIVASVALVGCGSDDVASTSRTAAPQSANVTTTAVQPPISAGSTSAVAASTSQTPVSTTTGRALTVLSSTVPAPASTTSDGRVSVAGVSFAVPEGWTAQSQAVAGTEFQAQARECVSVEVVDSPAPEASAELSNAVVQVCGVDPVDVPLESWLAGRGQATHTPATYGGCAVLQVSADPVRRIAYTDTSDARVEIVAVVATTPEKSELRRVEVGDLLDGMRCTTT